MDKMKVFGKNKSKSVYDPLVKIGLSFCNMNACKARKAIREKVQVSTTPEGGVLRSFARQDGLNGNL